VENALEIVDCIFLIKMLYSKNMAILIIEDEKKLADILKKALKQERYSVDVADTGTEGLEKALKNTYSLIILDVMLPGIDGFAVAKKLRAKEIHTPIIMLTARTITNDRVAGLDAGADDYLTKPFELNELFARIRALLRRPKASDPDTLSIADLSMDRKKHEVTRAGKVVDLTPKEYKLLNALLSSQGEAVEREKLISHAWGPEFKEAGNELNVHIRYLRRKIDNKKSKPLIHTIRGVGFALRQ
jgi:DNA-binding response OmpR family regulator